MRKTALVNWFDANLSAKPELNVILRMICFIMYVVVFVLCSVLFLHLYSVVRRMFLLVVFQQNPPFPAVMIDSYNLACLNLTQSPLHHFLCC